ncbi:sensor histidine kinase [Patulibacter americanus]|uniref:sensor histidine kinase n=1 Tax=Patulibacter americanus TaxID=588672 RepID=UPI0012F8AAC5|nr:sensor histidine kinase [Patulibacter americanus]
MTAPATVPGALGPDEPRWLVLLWTLGPAVVPLLIGMVGVLDGAAPSDRIWWGLAATVTAVAVAARIRHPVACWLGALLVVLSGPLQGSSGTVLLLAFVPALPLAALTAVRPPRTSLAAAAATWAALAGVAVVLDGLEERATGAYTLIVGALVLPGTAVLASWLIGYALFVRGRYAQALVDRARTLERERDTEAARAVAEERTRIARELHDVVSHNVSVMLVQASAADAVWEHDPARAREAVRAVQDTGRAAMGELRSMLRAMRGGDDEAAGAERRAQESLDRLPALVEQVRATGLDARLAVHGDVSGVDPAVGVSLLRVAQEALTNALRHADARRVDVALDVGPDAVSLVVQDDGRGLAGSRGVDEPEDPARRGGHGLVGMRERMTVLGGELEVGPAVGGEGPSVGTRVAVRAPLRQDAAR